jgi:hypothetical protein
MFSYSVNFSASVFGTLCAKGTAVSITSAVLFCLSMGAVSGLLKSTVVSVMTDLSQYKTLLADFKTGCGLHLLCFCQEAYTLWQSVGDLYLPVGCVSRHKRIQIVMSIQILRVYLFRSLYYSASVDGIHS